MSFLAEKDPTFFFDAGLLSNLKYNTFGLNWYGLLLCQKQDWGCFKTFSAYEYINDLEM